MKISPAIQAIIDEHLKTAKGRSKLIRSTIEPLRWEIYHANRRYDWEKPNGLQPSEITFQRRFRTNVVEGLLQTVSAMAPEEKVGDEFHFAMQQLEEYRTLIRRSLTCACYVSHASYEKMPDTMKQRYSPTSSL